MSRCRPPEGAGVPPGTHAQPRAAGPVRHPRLPPRCRPQTSGRCRCTSRVPTDAPSPLPMVITSMRVRGRGRGRAGAYLGKSSPPCREEGEGRAHLSLEAAAAAWGRGRGRGGKDHPPRSNSKLGSPASRPPRATPMEDDGVGPAPTVPGDTACFDPCRSKGWRIPISSGLPLVWPHQEPRQGTPERCQQTLLGGPECPWPACKRQGALTSLKQTLPSWVPWQSSLGPPVQAPVPLRGLQPLAPGGEGRPTAGEQGSPSFGGPRVATPPAATESRSLALASPLQPRVRCSSGSASVHFTQPSAQQHRPDGRRLWPRGPSPPSTQALAGASGWETASAPHALVSGGVCCVPAASVSPLAKLKPLGRSRLGGGVRVFPLHSHWVCPTTY